MDVPFEGDVENLFEFERANVAKENSLAVTNFQLARPKEVLG